MDALTAALPPDRLAGPIRFEIRVTHACGASPWRFCSGSARRALQIAGGGVLSSYPLYVARTFRHPGPVEAKEHLSRSHGVGPRAVAVQSWQTTANNGASGSMDMRDLVALARRDFA